MALGQQFRTEETNGHRAGAAVAVSGKTIPGLITRSHRPHEHL